MTEIKVHNGKPLGFGAVLTGGGVNFSIYSRDATKVSLVLFDSEYDQKPAQVIDLTRMLIKPATSGTYI